MRRSWGSVSRGAALLLGAGLLGACSHGFAAAGSSAAPAHPQAARAPAPAEPALGHLRLQTQGVTFDLLFDAADSDAAGSVMSSLLEAVARTSRWGRFREPVMVRVFPDHAALERATGRIGYPWLRGWAFADRMLLQSPSSWASSGEELQPQLNELLTHELTHALMYQLLQPVYEAPSAEAPGAVDSEPPFWFREGMASVTAQQGLRRMSAKELATWIDGHPGVDLLEPTDELYRLDKEAVYGAAHRAFEALLAIAGDQGIKDVLRDLRVGAPFPDAFAAATGQPLAQFERMALRFRFDLASIRTAAARGAAGP